MTDRIAVLEAKLAELATRNAELEALNNALVDRVAHLEAELSRNSETRRSPSPRTRKCLASRVLNVGPRRAPLVDGKESSPARRARAWPDGYRMTR